MSSKNTSGFTLLEILLALFIFAIVMVMVTSGFSVAMKAERQIDDISSRLARIQIAEAMLTRDISQMVARSIVDGDGTLKQALIVQPDDVTLIEFTRSGVINPQARDVRSSMMRVAYDLVDGQLIRKTWRVLDRAPTSEPDSRVLLNDVQKLSISWLFEQQNQQDQQPSEFVLAEGGVSTLPLALFIELQIGDKNLQRLISIPSARITVTSQANNNNTNDNENSENNENNQQNPGQAQEGGV